MACGERCPGFSDVCPDIRRAMACGTRCPGFSDSCLNLRRAIAPGAFSVLAGAPGGRFPAAARPDIRLFSQPDGQILPGFLQSDGQTARGRGQPVPNSPGSGAPRESRQPRFPCRGFTAYRSLPPALAGYGLLAAVCRPRLSGGVGQGSSGSVSRRASRQVLPSSSTVRKSCSLPSAFPLRQTRRVLPKGASCR